jgi:alpha-beta hydrolase superfamily lysophospholipase
MIREELQIESSSELILYVSVWKPETNIKAIVVLVHGLGEHCQRYAPYIEYFTKQGIAFTAFDLMGHGRSEGTKGTITEYQNLVDDVDICVMKSKNLFPAIPHFVYGHSMGGNIVINYLIEYNPQLEGAIVTSPWLKLTYEPPAISRMAANFLSKILPDITIPNGLKIEHISHLADEVKKYQTDPFNHNRISFLLYSSVVQYGRLAIKKAHLVKLPVLLMHGLDDQITSPVASKKMAQNNPALIEWKEWPNQYHELHNEIIRDKLADIVINWISKHLPNGV